MKRYRKNLIYFFHRVKFYEEIINKPFNFDEENSTKKTVPLIA